LSDGRPELRGQGLHVELVAQAGAEGLDRLLCVVAVPVEAAVHKVLDPPAKGNEGDEDGQGGRGDGQARAAGELAEEPLHDYDDPEIRGCEDAGRQTVDDSAVDDAVDVPEAVAEESNKDRQGDEKKDGLEDLEDEDGLL